MITINFDMGDLIALKHLLSNECDERQRQLVEAKSMRASYTRQELSDDVLQAWVLAASARLDEAVSLYKLVKDAYERS